MPEPLRGRGGACDADSCSGQSLREWAIAFEIDARGLHHGFKDSRISSSDDPCASALEVRAVLAAVRARSMGAEPEGCYDAPPTASMKRNFSGQVCRPEGAPPAPRSRPPPLRRKAATPRAPGVSRGPPCGYHAGQRVDVLDTVKKWAEAEVVRVDDAARRLLVTYTYWSDKWDEWRQEV